MDGKDTITPLPLSPPTKNKFLMMALQVMSILDEADLRGRFADSLAVHERRLFDSDLHLTLVLFPELFEELAHPWQRHLGRPCLV